MVLALLFVNFSCKKNLDDNLFNSSKLTEYKLDNYGGTVDFKVILRIDVFHVLDVEQIEPCAVISLGRPIVRQRTREIFFV